MNPFMDPELFKLLQITGQAQSLRNQQASLKAQQELANAIKAKAEQDAKDKHAAELQVRQLKDEMERLRQPSGAEFRQAHREPEGPQCPHCGGALPLANGRVKEWAKCKFCSSALLWCDRRPFASQQEIEAFQSEKQEEKRRHALAVEQRKAQAQRKSYLGSLGKDHRKQIARLSDIASNMPVVITGAGLEMNHHGAVCIKANLRNVSDRLLDEVRVVFVSDNNDTNAFTRRERINPLEKVQLSFAVEGLSAGDGGSLWVSFAASCDGTSWEQSVEEARAQPRGVTPLRLRDA